MTTTHHEIDESTAPRIEPVLTMTQLCEQLQVPVQTLYDLRCQGRGPTGFRVGRELRFRLGEIQAWLRQLESLDGEPHTSERQP